MSKLQSIGAYYSDQIMITQTNNKQRTQPMTAVETEAIREYYEMAMKPWDAVAYTNDMATKLDTWHKTRSQFDSIISDIESRLQLSNASTNEQKEEPIVIRINGKNWTFDSDKTITVGRIDFTDIPLADVDVRLNGTSRLHAIIRRFGNQLVIMDVGSYSGIRLIERSVDGAPCERSQPGDRRPLIIGIHEHAIFKLGPNLRMTVNPKECVLMLSLRCTGTRDFRGQCGHFICCGQCATDWRVHSNQGETCPQCRAPFFGPAAEFNADHAKTCVKL